MSYENGGYKHEIQSESDDSADTSTTTDRETSVEVNRDGTITRKVMTEKKVDTKILFNEQINKTKEDVIENPDGTETIIRKSTVNGEAVEDVKTSRP